MSRGMGVPTNQVFLQGPVTPVSADALNSFLQVVGSVALLRQFTGVNNQTIWLAGTTTVNDGGQSVYFYSAASVAADNGTTVVAPTGSTVGRWLQQPASAGAGAFTSLTVSSGTVTLNSTTSITSDGTTITANGKFATTGLATVNDLAVTASHSTSFALAVSSAGAGAPTWRQLAFADISGLGNMAQQAAGAVAVTGGTIDGAVIGGVNPVAGTFTTVSATSVQAGAAGFAGTVTVYPATTSRGTLQISTASNAGNTTTGLIVAAQAGARTYTVQDHGGSASFLLTGATLGASGIAGSMQAPLTAGLTSTGIPMTASATSANFGVSLTAGTSLALTTNAANNSTVTNTVVWEIVLPPSYIAAQNVTVTVNGNYVLGAGTVGTHTLAMTAYLNANAGTQGANLIATAAQSVPVAAGDMVFTITGTTLSPGSRVILQGVLVVQATTANNITAVINSVRLS